MNSSQFRLIASVAPILAAGALGAAPAQAAILDFEQFGVTNSAGDINGGSQNLNGAVVDVDGVGITLDAITPTGLPLTTFDANCVDGSSPTGGDGDLCLDGFNNVLIVNENFNFSNPDDNNGEDTLSFSFSEAVALNSIDILDNDVPSGLPPSTIVAFLGGSELGTIELQNTADRDFETIDLSLFGPADALEVSFFSSGAVDNLDFTAPTTAIPEPTTLLGLVLGGGALVAAKRQRRG